MLLYELESQAVTPAHLLALAELLKGRDQDTAAKAPISVEAFLKIANSMGIAVSRDTLQDLIAKPPLSNIIKSLEGDALHYHGAEPEELETDTDQEVDQQRVAQLAKRQLNRS
jgi:hypothetical protein